MAQPPRRRGTPDSATVRVPARTRHRDAPGDRGGLSLQAPGAPSRHAPHGPCVYARPARRRRVLARPAAPFRALSLAGTERRAGLVLVVALVLLTSLFAVLPAASAHQPAAAAPVTNPGIADLRAPLTEDVTAPAAGAAGPELAEPAAPASGPYTADGTLLTALSAAPAPSPLQVRLYAVVRGDTLTGIAARFGLSMMSIWWSNHLASKDQLRVGQVLVIPPVEGVVYTAAAGDTVPAVADRYHADPDAIRTYNALTTDELTLGEQVMIPNGVGPAIAVTATPAGTRSTGRTTSQGSGGGGGAAPAGFAPLLWPVRGGYISQGYGCTGFPYEPPYGSCAHFHTGIDIAAPVGTAVVAAAAGTVTYAGWRNNDGGYQVEVSDGHGFYTGYYHLSAVLAHVGQRLSRGQLLGRVGSTGHSTGPHLLFAVWIGPIWAGGYPVNPLDYF